MPSVKSKNIDTPNIVKVVTNKKKKLCICQEPQYLTNLKRKKYSLKHLSIISFKPKALLKFKSEKTNFDRKIEGIELMRALEIGLENENYFSKR